MALRVYAGISYGFHVDTFALAVASHAWPIFKPAARTLDVITQTDSLIVEGSPRAHIRSLPLEVVERVRQALWWESCRLARREHLRVTKEVKRDYYYHEMDYDYPPTSCWSRLTRNGYDDYMIDLQEFCYGIGVFVTNFCSENKARTSAKAAS